MARTHSYPSMDEPENMTAMYNPKLFEGDIVYTAGTFSALRSYNPGIRFNTVPGVQRNAVKQAYLKWTEGRIPYTISSQYSSFSRAKIAEALDEYKKKTCIQFSPKSAADQDYIHIVPDDGCYSLVGRVGGKQPVSLGDGCIQKGIIIHELMHAVGFFHEQSRADRDEYIVINWNNVEPGLQDQFDKYSLSMIDHLGTKYDYESVMHYAPTAFSKNGKPTIEPKQANVEIGQRMGFSANDLYKINKLYNCSNLEEVETVTTLSKAAKKPLTAGKTGTGSSIKKEIEENSGKPVEEDCVDRRRDCEFLARAGHCDSKFSKKFMAENCSKSCDKCPTEKVVKETDKSESTKCEDARTWCEKWANSGMCTQALFKPYMSKKCAKSCQLC
ncbi:unnamed protein product [Auanema sp. JU1783]|nr:unnamed protein product [Auanema sp. JU1783]